MKRGGPKKYRPSEEARKKFREQSKGLVERMEKSHKADIRKLRRQGIPVSGKLSMPQVIFLEVVAERIKKAQYPTKGKKLTEVLKENKARIVSIGFLSIHDPFTMIVRTSKGTNLNPLKITVKKEEVTIEELKD